MTVVADTSFLSSLLKINRAELILKFFEIDHILVPSHVFEELKKAPFFEEKLHLFTSSEDRNCWIKVVDLAVRFNADFGSGEIACIQLAKETNSVLLIDDKRALKYAKASGIKVCFDLVRFLLACKESKLISNHELIDITCDVKEKDHYSLTKDDYELLLGE